MHRVSFFRLQRICVSKHDRPVAYKAVAVWESACGIIQPAKHGAITRKPVTCDVCKRSFDHMELLVKEQYEEDVY